MKKIMLLLICFATVISCSRKTVPATTAETKHAAATEALIISDGYGRIITPQKNLPQDANVKMDYLKLSRGFTPQQRANLKTRCKIILPRVLYVDPQYQLKSLKGIYYIYRKKFWYWKKEDSLFYLDGQYYL